jgi:hypothetical protein
MGIIKEIMYFDKPDRKNTDELIPFAIKRMQEMNIKNVVVVWSSGYTVRKFLEVIGDGRIGLNIIAVTNPSPHSISRGVMPIVITARDTEEQRKMKEEQLKKGITEISTTISDEVKAELEALGLKVCYLNDDLMLGEPLALGKENTGRRARLIPFGVAPHIRPLDIDAGGDLSLFTTISQGFRVAVGCTILAVKYGFIPEGELTMAIAGRSTGLILRAGGKPKTTIIKEIIGFERGSSHFERDPEHPDGD